MRKLKLQMQISLDGFSQYGENDEQHWVTWAFHEIRDYVMSLQRSCDTQIIGRKLAVDYYPYWFETLKNPNDPMHEVAQVVTSFRNIIFSKTLEKVDWPNTELAIGDLVETVNALKKESGKDIMVVGGTTFVSKLIAAGLIDEYHLFVNPVVLGNGGVSVFNKLKSFRSLTLKNSITYDSGIVLLHYEPKK